MRLFVMSDLSLLKVFDQFDDRFTIPFVRSSLFGTSKEERAKVFSAPEIDIDFYDVIVVSMSGGKDSIAAFLRLLEMGVDLKKVEFWHNLVDGNEGELFADWKFMDSYNQKLAKAFNVPLYNSWVEHGFLGEMLKNNSYSHNYKIETPDGLITRLRDLKKSKRSTRLKYPQQSASLTTRWCSSVLKIDVGRRALTNQERFRNKKILFVTGERREESSNRAKYFQLEKHLCDSRLKGQKRWVDSWRPVLEYTEQEVWQTLERHNVQAPVPYRLGWGRSSCMTCIYNSPKIWATINQYFPDRIERIAAFEDQFKTTISRKKINVKEVSAHIEAFDILDLEALEQARKSEYELPIFTSDWRLPVGAFNAEGCGSV